MEPIIYRNNTPNAIFIIIFENGRKVYGETVPAFRSLSYIPTSPNVEVSFIPQNSILEPLTTNNPVGIPAISGLTANEGYVFPGVSTGPAAIDGDYPKDSTQIIIRMPIGIIPFYVGCVMVYEYENPNPPPATLSSATFLTKIESLGPVSGPGGASEGRVRLEFRPPLLGRLAKNSKVTFVCPPTRSTQASPIIVPPRTDPERAESVRRFGTVVENATA